MWNVVRFIRLMHTRLFAGQREWPSSYDWSSMAKKKNILYDLDINPCYIVYAQYNVMILCLFGIVKRFRNNNNRFLFFVTNHVAHVICYMYIYMCADFK